MERPLGRGERRVKLDRHKIKIVILYVLLLAGGLWHVLGVLQTAMRELAAPMLAALSLWLGYEYFRRHAERQFIFWSLLVCLAGFGIELVGVKTGAIFGAYFYGETLQPRLWNVPVAIGFAWLGMIICSTAISQHLFPAHFSNRPVLNAVLIAMLMVIFDWCMEPAAMKLGYWTWRDGNIPPRNYLAWFICGFMLSYSGLRLGLFSKRLSAFAAHAYVAQLGYFALVSLA
jgi:putative membrane protein